MNRDDFETQINLYRDRLVRFVASLLFDPHRAEDVVQVVLIYTYARFTTFSSSNHLRNTLFRVARHQAINVQRKIATRDKHLEPLGYLFANATEEAADQPLIDDEECQRRNAVLWQAITSLSEHLRTVLMLREIEGMEYSDIAEVLEITVKTAYTRHFRAVDILRENPQLRNLFETTNPKVKHED